MLEARRPTEEDVFDLRIGLDEAQIPLDQKHWFDINGYVVLEGLLSPARIEQARAQSARMAAARRRAAPGGQNVEQLVHIVEDGGLLEDAMALEPVLEYLRQFIWGNQYRLVGSRALLRVPGRASRLKQGGDADERRYARYRCFGDGQFRCLMMTCLISLSPTSAADGAFCVVPGSHKAHFRHPYEEADLDAIGLLLALPLPAGSAVLLTESLSYAFKAPAARRQRWLAYHYGPSYMVNWPGCEPSPALRARVACDPHKAHLLLDPYYHPAGAHKKKD